MTDIPVRRYDMSQKIGRQTPLGNLTAEANEDPTYPEIYIMVGNMQLACIGYYDGSNSLDPSHRFEIKIWLDGDGNDPTYNIPVPAEYIKQFGY